MTTQNETAERPAELAATNGSETLLDAFVRLDKIIRDCGRTLLTADQLKAKGRSVPEAELEDVRSKMSAALIERDFLDGLIQRRCSSPNTAGEQPPPTTQKETNEK